MASGTLSSKKISRRISWEIAKRSFLPFVFLSAVLASYFFSRLKGFPGVPLSWAEDFSRYLKTLFILAVAFMIQRVAGGVLLWYENQIAPKTESMFDDVFVPLLNKIVRIAVWVISLIIILPVYGINVGALVATLGVTSLAVALAAQDTIANIIAGFLIMIDVPFREGDIIKIPSGEKVRVLKIGMRRSRFKAGEEEAIIIVPNLDLSKSKIVNYTAASREKEDDGGEKS